MDLLADARGGGMQLTYPADLLRRRMQMVGLKSQALGYEYTGALQGERIRARTVYLAQDLIHQPGLRSRCDHPADGGRSRSRGSSLSLI